MYRCLAEGAQGRITAGRRGAVTTARQRSSLLSSLRNRLGMPGRMGQVVGVMGREPIKGMAHEDELEGGVPDLPGKERAKDGPGHVLVGPEARQTTIETIEIGKLIELVFY